MLIWTGKDLLDVKFDFCLSGMWNHFFWLMESNVGARGVD